MSQELVCKCTCDALQATQLTTNQEVGLTIAVVIMVLIVIVVAGVAIYNSLPKHKEEKDGKLDGQSYY